MAYFLVDYENVCGHQGLRGIEYLDEGDSLIFFFSAGCNKISQADIRAIKSTGCLVETYQLKVARANALDFYIATKTGMLSKEDPQADIAIISRDKGFLSIIDFASILDIDNIVVAPDIESAFIFLQAPCYEARKTIIKENIKKMNLDSEINRIKSIQSYKRRVEDVLATCAVECNMREVVNFAVEMKDTSPKETYSKALHIFGRTKGLQIYRIIKELNEE